MSYRDLFIVLIRAFAGYHLLIAVLNCIELVNNYFFDANTVVDLKDGAWLAILVSLAFLLFLIYKTTWLVDFLKLDQGFESPRLDLKSINSGNIAAIIIFFIGSSFILNGLIHIGSIIFLIIKDGGIRFYGNNLLQGITLILGILMIYKKNWIANLIVKEKV